ncbi:unnamed protein product [Vicia faba]|uniref:Uncharacterized protein n=1 Tax=Vicia faba TaxID=3906 RepID=A0AAV1AAD9_VICFA|nr:unnamed protein product [Vicia faba]
MNKEGFGVITVGGGSWSDEEACDAAKSVVDFMVAARLVACCAVIICCIISACWNCICGMATARCIIKGREYEASEEFVVVLGESDFDISKDAPNINIELAPELHELEGLGQQLLPERWPLQQQKGDRSRKADGVGCECCLGRGFG